MMWRRMDNPGHEWARLSGSGSGHVLRGTAVFMEALVPCRLDYKILCNPFWETLNAEVLGWIGERKIKLGLERSPDMLWQMNGRPVAAVNGCIDIDFSFSPSTNLLPIRRLNLKIGQEVEVRAAWLRFPDLDLQPLVQRFRRESERRYFYDSDIGFSTQLEVNSDGFVVNYPPLWMEEAGD